LCAPIDTVSISTAADNVNVIAPPFVTFHLSAVFGISVNAPLVPAFVDAVEPINKFSYKIRA